MTWLDRKSFPSRVISAWRTFKYRFLTRHAYLGWDPQDPTFQGWLDRQDMALCKTELRGAGIEHEHVLVPADPEEAEEAFHRYLEYYAAGKYFRDEVCSDAGR